MPLYSNVSVTVTSLGGGDFQFQVGQETFTANRDHLRDMVVGRDKDYDFLLHQIALQLDAQGVDPRSVTLAQLKTIVEAMTLKW